MMAAVAVPVPMVQTGIRPGLTDWTNVDQKGSTTGYCTTGNESDIDVDVKWDNGFGYALRLKHKDRSATRSVNLSGASVASPELSVTEEFLGFQYRNADNVIVQASKDGTNFGTVFTIAGQTGNNDSAYVNIYNQDITKSRPFADLRYLYQVPDQ